jgi:GGDEF domain-containing protein
MTSLSDPLIPETIEQTALACYLRTVVAVGHCMAEVCPSVGSMYRDRLLKLPRRLGFEATPLALQQSREAVETDLLEFARTAGAWTSAGSNHAAQLLDHLRETEEMLVASADLQNAFLDDLAEHIATSAEVDDEAHLRTSFKRYAAGLSAYARRARSEKREAIEELRRRREEIEEWLAAAATANFIDDDSGLLNRTAAEMRIETEISKKQPFCAIVVSWTGEGLTSIEDVFKQQATGQIMKELGERLAATIRPYDMVFRWSERELVTIFEATAAEIPTRVQLISGWLGDGTCTVEIGGETSIVKTHTTISVVEHHAGERAHQLISRIEAESRQELVAR